MKSIFIALKEKLCSNEIYSHITAVFSIVLLYGGMQLFGITCPIKFLTGISCAGCGMTRAYLALLHFDLKQAFYYHPLFWLPPIVLMTFLAKKNLNRHIYRGILIISAALFIFVYLYRLFWGNDTIVVFQPENGLFLDILERWNKA